MRQFDFDSPSLLCTSTSACVKMVKWTFQREMEPEYDKIKVLWWVQIRTWCHHFVSSLDNVTALNLKVLN